MQAEILSGKAERDDTFLETLQKINTELEREMKREYAQNHGPGLGLDLGWCYLQDGRTDLGIRTVVRSWKQKFLGGQA
ncbi:MAG: hypothetical protein ACLU77_00920 [Waltera sp.]